jgi:NhaA family Na+:H+ antiporter
MYRVASFVRRFAKALVAGALLATAWVNLDPASYYDAIELRLADVTLPQWVAPMGFSVTPMLIVSHGLMALFLALVGKEMWEALVLGQGALSGQRRGGLSGRLSATGRTKIAAVTGAVIGAVAVWIAVGAGVETADEARFATGWPLPIGSEVALCYLFGSWAFGRGHPALHLLLLITIALDVLGLLTLGLAFPAISLRLAWLGLTAAAVALVWLLCARKARPGMSETARRRALARWPYALAGLVSWAGVALAGLPPTLGLLPLIPVIPHADRSFGLFAEAEELLHDPLNGLAQLLVWPVLATLFLFGLTRGGIDFSAFAPTTLTVLASLWLGKPFGLILGVVIAGLFAGALLPEGVRLRDLPFIGLLTGIGFTVPVLAIDAALPGGAMNEAARLGLALSLLAGPTAVVLARLAGIRRPRQVTA